MAPGHVLAVYFDELTELELTETLSDGSEPHHVQHIIIGEGAKIQLVSQDLKAKEGPINVISTHVEL